MIVYVGDWRTGAVAAEPPHRAGVYGPEAGTSHQALPPHWEGQAGVLPTVCYVAGVGGHGQNYIQFYVLILWNTLYFTHGDFLTLGIPAPHCWIHYDMKWLIYFVLCVFVVVCLFFSFFQFCPNSRAGENLICWRSNTLSALTWGSFLAILRLTRAEIVFIFACFAK